jgi:natural product biosynthesis luciferase-like monooxygenase protein/amino acid adenylation domain-containing protein
VRRETEGLIGFFVNTLALRTRVRWEESFAELLERVRETCLGAYGHQDVPFEKLVEELQPERSMSHAPLFQVFFALQNLPRNPLQLSNLHIQRQPVEDERAKFDLTVNIIDRGASGLEVKAIYRRDLFEEGTVSRILEHYEQLLKTITTGVQRKLWELSPMTAAEREQVLVEWNQSEREYEGSRCVHECFEAQSERTPEAGAVEFEEKQLSYRELNERANQLAHYLRSIGVGPEVLVGVLLERSIELLVAVLGVLKAGGAYVPLDAGYPRQRLMQMLTDGKVRVLLTEQQLAGSLAFGNEIELVSLDTDQAAISRQPSVNPGSGVSDRNLAYVIFTSGSTGQPKGVQIPHGAVVNLLRSMSEQPGMTSEDVVLSVTPLTFDIAALELFLPLMVGASVVLVSREVAANGVELSKRLSSRISVMQATPATWRLLITTGWRGNDRLKILCGGEALNHQLAQELLTRGASLWNLYGPTESTIWSAIHEVAPDEQVIPIGKPIANTRLYLLDNNFEPVPVGAVGELYIGGVGLARGYLNPSQTAERFLPNPFSTNPGARLYRTGDIARFSSDGKIQFAGRRDEQVKVRGYRIELGEIEGALSRQQGIDECVVQVREGQDSERRLVAYVVRQPGAVVESGEWRRRLEETLPQYMIPAAFVELERLPLTPNGKVDRQALAALPLRFESDEGGESPATPVEELLAGIWREVLGVGEVSRGANFFELGGHSLLLTQVMVRVREVLGVELPLRLMFELPALADLASEVERQRGSKEGQAAAAPIETRKGEQELPLSFAQQRLWLLDQLEPENAAYNLPLALRLRGELDEAALERALGEIVRRHEVLRAKVEMRASGPVQVIGADGFGGLERVDLSHLDEEAAEREAQQVVNEVGRRPFDLGRGPLLRAQLVRLGRAEQVLVVVMHHIASDGWSLGVFARELSRLYEAYREGGESPLEELGIQYGDYARWQREWLREEVLGEQLSYWREQLSGAPGVLELPSDRVRPAVQSFAGGMVRVELSRELKEELAGLGRRRGSTLFMVLLTGFQVLLARYAGVGDVVVGTPVAGRVRRETEGLIGFFVNTLALRTRVRWEESFAELLERVRETCLGAYGHQDVPFEKLVEELQPERSMSHTPLFQVFFALQNLPRHSLQLSNLHLQPQSVDTERVAHDLSLMLSEQTDGRIAGSLRYATALFDSTTIERMVTNFLTLLHSIAVHSDEPVSNLRLLSDQEQQLLLGDWNDTTIEYPVDRCLHQLFEEQVDRTPDDVAIVFDDEQLTYKELNARANQLARYLQRLGAEPEARVGILVERSAEMMIGLLGILKSGAAYVPLDPNYPQERLSFMLADAGVKILVTQSHLAELLPVNTTIVCLDDEWERIASESEDQVDSAVTSGNAAYVIYTSGSTGKPKGVVVCHRNLINFVTGMDQRIGDDKPGTWLSVTSISFDISVLELFWTLARGYKVLIQGSEEAALAAEDSGEVALKGMDFSLFYFASDEASHEKDIYKLLIEGAKFADEHNFTAVWTPERHFHAFGGPYPNPAVTGAALATITKRIQIRAGSVVVPLHDPIRVAEEWSVIDNLSNGRVALSFASGWQANDFVFSPESYAKRHEVMFKNIEIIRGLWRGESITRRDGGAGEIEVAISPRPIQPELPIWITAAGSPKTFEKAGEMGANLLTHLLGQSLEELKAKIDLYRAAWQRNHHAGSGHVTLMLHAFIDPDEDRVLEKVRQPFSNYLRSSIGLLQSSAKSLGRDLNLANLTEADMDAVLAHSFARYYETSSLMGTPARCLEMVNQLKVIGVDEIGCLIDFGVDADSVLSGLEHLNALRESTNRRARKRRENHSIGEQIRRHQVTHMQCTPSLARILSAEPGGLASLQSLEKFFLGGEALPLSLAKQVSEEFPGELFNMYGPTETTIWSSTHRLTETETMVPLGRPIANTRIYILDRNLQLCPIGTSGELFIGGAGVVRGYLNRPELTAERFVPDPYRVDPGATMYRTGDLARYHAGGEIEFLGRLDYQVKLRGFRVEPGEIEAVVESDPDVKSCIVIARADAGQDPRLIAYVVPVDEQVELSIPDLRRHVKQSLPEYMLPAAFVPLQTLPLTPNGKVDRSALPDPDQERPEIETTFVTVRDPVEEIVAGIWENLLRLDKVGTEDNFFELGGHSLLAVRVVMRLREVFHLDDVPLRLLFEKPTVSGIARVVEERMKTASHLPHQRIKRAPDGETPVLSLTQESWLVREWVEGLSSVKSKVMNSYFGYRLNGPLNLTVLEQSLNEIIRRHESLRTTFPRPKGLMAVGILRPVFRRLMGVKVLQKIACRRPHNAKPSKMLGDPVPLILDNVILSLPVIDLGGLNEEEQASESQRIAAATARDPFDYEKGPLIRAVLLRIREDEHVLCVVLHHYISDGWSVNVFTQELRLLYDAFASGNKSPLPELPIQYTDYARWQREWLQGEVLDTMVSYWKDTKTSPFPEIELPFAHTPGTSFNYRGNGRREKVVLSSDLYKALKDLSKREGATLYMVLLSTLYTLLHHYTALNQIGVFSSLVNRCPETQGLIGWFAHFHALEADLSANPRFSALLKQVRESLLGAFEHQELPYALLVRRLVAQFNYELPPYNKPWVYFDLKKQTESASQMGSLSLTPFIVAESVQDVAIDAGIELIGVEGDSGLSINLSYSGDRFDAADIKELLRRYQFLLTSAVAKPEAQLSELLEPLSNGAGAVKQTQT